MPGHYPHLCRDVARQPEALARCVREVPEPRAVT
jgi:hypothetical protein